MVKEETTNINVEVDKDLWTALRIQALEKGIDFHSHIRTILQKATR